MKKRFGSILLVFVLAFSMLPWTAISARALEKPERPELETCTDKSITLKAVTPPEGCTVEYGIADGSTGVPRWQAETTFTQGANGKELTDEHFYYFRVRYRQDGVDGEPSEDKSLHLPYLAPNLPSDSDGSGYLGCISSNYAVYDVEKGKMTACWDRDNRIMRMDGFVGAEGQYLSLSRDCTLLLKGENAFDCAPNSNSLWISNGRDVVIRGADKGARLAVRGMNIQTNALRIEDCTVDASWICKDGEYRCATVRCPQIALTDARLLCSALPKPASEGAFSCAFDMARWEEACSITLTRSILRVAAPKTADEALCSEVIYHRGEENAQTPSLLALTLADRSAVELNGERAIFTQLGAIAVSTDRTSSAMLRGNVSVNHVNSTGDISLGGNITIAMKEGNIQANVLNITAPGVTLTAAGYHFNDCTLAAGVDAYPSLRVHKEEGYGGYFVDADGERLTGTVRFVKTLEQPGIKLARLASSGIRCLLTAPENTLLLAASYDAGGRLTGIGTVKIDGECKPAEKTVRIEIKSGYTYKLMLVNRATIVPLCEAWEIAAAADE